MYIPVIVFKIKNVFTACKVEIIDCESTFIQCSHFSMFDVYGHLFCNDLAVLLDSSSAMASASLMNGLNSRFKVAAMNSKSGL